MRTTTAPAFVDTLFRSVRHQLKVLDSGFASVVGDEATLAEAQRVTDTLFSLMRFAPHFVYRSLLRPVSGCSLFDLCVAVGVE